MVGFCGKAVVGMVVGVVVVGVVIVKITAKGKQRRRAQNREKGVGDSMVCLLLV